MAEQYVEPHEQTEQQPALTEKTAPVPELEAIEANVEAEVAKPKRKRSVKPKTE